MRERVGADHLGHTNVSMTQDKYMARGWNHIEVAELLDNVDKLTGSSASRSPFVTAEYSASHAL